MPRWNGKENPAAKAALISGPPGIGKSSTANIVAKHLNYEIESKLINFKTIVPKKTHFYSCHFRVDIFRYLSTLKNVYSVLLDLDVLVLSNPEKILYYQKNMECLLLSK